MCSRRIASYLAADHPMLLGELPRLTAVHQDRLAVPSVRDILVDEDVGERL
jgi:hypothetical protein